jgi:hypothetical protein
MLRWQLIMLTLQVSGACCVLAQAPRVPARGRPDRLVFRAADGTISEVRRRGASGPDHSISVTSSRGGVDVAWVRNDAGGCRGPESVEHRVRRHKGAEVPDSVVVWLGYGVNPCPAVYTPAPYLLTVRGLAPGWYTLHVETRQAGTSQPWLTYILAVP